MPKALYIFLSRREAQIMDAIYRLGEASVAEVQAHIPKPSGYNSVRVLINILEKKGYLTHRKEGQKYIYQPTDLPENARRTALDHMVTTFFDGSTSKAVSALLDMNVSKLSEEDLKELMGMIKKAKQERNNERTP